MILFETLIIKTSLYICIGGLLLILMNTQPQMRQYAGGGAV